MVQSQDVREVFHKSLMELVARKSIEKISVQEIVNNTNLSRQTFYRYFKDKYDLINWSMKVFLDQLADKVQSRKMTRYQVLVELLDTIKKWRPFFKSAFTINAQNAPVDFFFQYSVKVGILNYTECLDDEKLRYEINFAYGFYSYGVIGSIVNWTISGAKEDPEYIADLIFENMPEKVRHFCCLNDPAAAMDTGEGR